MTAIALLAAELRDEYGLEKAGEYLALMFEAVDARKETSENPHVGWDDPDDCGTDDLDEFIARDVDTVHFEALDQSRWYANVYLNDGQVWTLNFGAKNPAAHGYANAEQIQ